MIVRPRLCAERQSYSLPVAPVIMICCPHHHGTHRLHLLDISKAGDNGSGGGGLPIDIQFYIQERLYNVRAAREANRVARNSGL
jgi:hypothetical protein